MLSAIFPDLLLFLIRTLTRYNKQQTTTNNSKQLETCLTSFPIFVIYNGFHVFNFSSFQVSGFQVFIFCEGKEGVATWAPRELLSAPGANLCPGSRGTHTLALGGRWVGGVGGVEVRTRSYMCGCGPIRTFTSTNTRFL